MPDHLAWRRVDFTSPVSPELARSVLLGLATIAGNPRIVLEVHASDHRVAWRVGADESALAKVRAVLRAQIPDVRITPTRSTFADADIDQAASVAVPHSRTLPLRHDPAAVEQVTRQLFDVLASTGRTELVRLQLILGPRTTPKIAPVIDGITRHGSRASSASTASAARCASPPALVTKPAPAPSSTASRPPSTCSTFPA
ncbi:hypothetical protein [Serinicoccus marinus]|uniref:hypothetical protein n=1 Tax=Serinicoccus marinus TaxID=247333 RepID=UPI0024933AA7|nr:hypothetical protein [Serinicoccus marinus]